MDKVIRKHLRKIQQQEEKLLQKKGGNFLKPITGKVEEKIPPELHGKLQQAFYLGFKTVFEKGNLIIEKTYDREELLIHHRVYDQSFDLIDKKKSLKHMNKMAGQNKLKNLGLTAVEGSGLGLLGIGLPDIPVFIGVVLKSVYETALSYGYDYHKTDEQYFILRLLEASLAPDDEKESVNMQVDKLIDYYVKDVSVGYDMEFQMRQTADAFATDMLCLKFIQGLPLIGVIGGAVNVSYCKKISDYARIKYQKRYLMQKEEQQYRKQHIPEEKSRKESEVFGKAADTVFLEEPGL